MVHLGKDLSSGLYIVATPLGNARDITLRALDVLTAVDAVLCEDTRVTGKLLAHHGISKPLRAYHDHNEQAASEKALAALAAGQRLALVTDAGTPLVSDPGYRITRAAREAGFAVHAVPGPSAPITALSIAGLASDRFSFLGFLPNKAGARRSALAAIVPEMGTIILFESPRRLVALCRDIGAVLGPCKIVVARELTKIYEEMISGTADELVAHFEQTPAKGECVVLIERAVPQAVDTLDLDALLRAEMAQLSLRDAARAVALKTGLPRKTLYDRALAIARAEEAGKT